MDIQVEKLTDEKIASWLEELERRYEMTSQQFLLAYNTGKLDDRDDFIDWSGLLWIAAAEGLYPKTPA